jgi:hypothetical protein
MVYFHSSCYDGMSIYFLSKKTHCAYLYVKVCVSLHFCSLNVYLQRRGSAVD